MMEQFLNTLKKAAQQAIEESTPSTILFGTVTSISPLNINVEQKMNLTSEFLILTKNVVDYETEMTINWSTEIINQNMNHSHDVSVTGEASVSIGQYSKDLSHSHGIKGRKKVTIHNALKNGDKVILIRQQGGQKYVVLDKIY